MQPQRQAASKRCVLHSSWPPKRHPRLLINPHSACCTQPCFPRVHSLRVFEHRPLRPLDRSAWAGIRKPPQYPTREVWHWQPFKREWRSVMISIRTLQRAARPGLSPILIVITLGFSVSSACRTVALARIPTSFRADDNAVVIAPNFSSLLGAISIRNPISTLDTLDSVPFGFSNRNPQ